MNLSENFTLAEMLRSANASKMGYKEQFTPSKEVVENLTELCTHILQPLRNHIGQSIFIGSGYRCERLNKAVKGAKNSQHLAGQAADLQATGKMSNRKLFDTILDLELPFDQLIWEFGTKEEPAWVHVSYSERNRGQILYVGI